MTLRHAGTFADSAFIARGSKISSKPNSSNFCVVVMKIRPEESF